MPDTEDWRTSTDAAIRAHDYAAWMRKGGWQTQVRYRDMPAERHPVTGEIYISGQRIVSVFASSTTDGSWIHASWTTRIQPRAGQPKTTRFVGGVQMRDGHGTRTLQTARYLDELVTELTGQPEPVMVPVVAFGRATTSAVA